METLLTVIKTPGEAKGFIGYVARLANDLQFNVHLVYIQEPQEYTMVQPPSAGIASSAQILEKNADNAKKVLAGLIEEIKDESTKGISISYSAEIARTITVINDYISNNKAGMVILEEDEKSSFWSQSSSTSDIVNQAGCPVWVIPFNHPYKPFKNIVYATDYKEEDIKTLKNLIGLTYRFSPAVTALHITDTSDFEEKIKETGFSEIVHSKTGYQNISVISLNEKGHNSAAGMINDYALEIGADLIVILKENKSFLNRIISPGETGKIIKEAGLPVLVYSY